jgi:hypothetical protein
MALVTLTSSRVIPSTETLHVDDSRWKEIHMQILQDIIHFGCIKPQYKASTCKRCWNIGSTAVCCTTICSSCLVWDCFCCMASVICLRSNPCRWGCTFRAIARVCDETYEDEREVQLKKFNWKNVSYKALREVCVAYLAEFDQQVSYKNAAGGKRANIIREKLFEMLRKYTPALKYCTLKDNGDIQVVRNIIDTELHKLYYTTTQLKQF